MKKSYKIALIPLDDRPVSTRYPQMLAAIGGADLRLPPTEVRGHLKQPADLAQVAKWLQEQASKSDACIVSCDFIGYGNLINSRITDESLSVILGRLEQLVQIGKSAPVHAFSLITRVSNADNATEEPAYWEEWGPASTDTRVFDIERSWES